MDRLFVITISIIREHFFSSLISLVPSATLLSKIASLSEGETRREFAWEDWGPEGSRLISAPPTHTGVWVCYVYGMTLALVRRIRLRQTIIFYDFNPLTIRRALLQSNDTNNTEAREHANEGLVTAVTDFSRTEIFKDPVRTALPYWSRQTEFFGGDGGEGEGHFDAVMVSEDSLIMVSSVSPLSAHFSVWAR